MTLRFCSATRCPHYGKATKYPRKCYDEPQCLRGWLDRFIDTIMILILRRLREVSE